MDNMNVVTLAQAKAMGIVGTRFRVEFTSPSAGTREFFGTIIPGLSAHGKPQAELECTICGAKHVREQSDWHHCWKCPSCKKPSGKSAGTVASAAAALLQTDPELAQLQRQVMEAKAAKAAAERAKQVAEMKAKLLAELAALGE